MRSGATVQYSAMQFLVLVPGARCKVPGLKMLDAECDVQCAVEYSVQWSVQCIVEYSGVQYAVE